ncbi:Na+/H+ antiporter NhaC family protein [Feifania hominis]|uniref:Na+/H+ antiporter NhaC family protein n=1 Tax=Feifania hominis TaxID=2763660 RepID=UPI003D28F1A9
MEDRQTGVETVNKKGNPLALLPIGVFLALFVGVGVASGDFYVMPAVVGFVIAFAVALCLNPKRKLSDKLAVAARSMGEENIMTMCLIFILAGGFSGAVSAAGGVESTVNLGLSVLPARFAVAGLFVIGCFISLSMGTSMGTIAALAPIAAGISEKTGIEMAICIAAVVCGAMFGDNLSMISDTTIAAARTQGCDMRDKFTENFLIVLPAAVITVGIFLALTWNSSFELREELTFNLWRVLPYLVILVGALVGVNVFVVLLSGTALALVVGIATGAFALAECFQVVAGGIESMYEITVISMLVAGIVGLVREAGGIDWIMGLIRRRVRSERGAEFGVAALVSAVDVATANNTVAIVIAGPIAKEISDEFHVEPKRTASLLDIFASVWQGVIPYGAQLLSAAELTALTPFAIIPYLFYPLLMALSSVGFILLRKRTPR